MSDEDDPLDKTFENMNKAADNDNTLDMTVFYSGKATTFAILTLLIELKKMNRRLEKIEEHLSR